jgi:succinate dehydrogenase/fumarate reductase flavoprotein subunit
VVALEAQAAGAKVLILEKLDEGGGTTRVSGGGFVGVSNIADAISYFDAMRQGSNTSREMIDAMIREQVNNLDYVTKLGAKYQDYGGAQFPGFPGSATVRKYQITGPSGTGENLWKMFDDNVKAKGIEVLYSTPAKTLITNCEGAVVGAVADSKGQKINIKAKRAVVLTTGGFEFNDVMLRDFVISQPYLTTAAPGNTGDGISMAQKVGAQLWHMTMPLGPYLGPAYPDLKGSMFNLGMPTNAWMVVDKYAKRVVNEYNSGAHSMLWAKGILTYSADAKGLIEFPAIPAYVIFDETSRAKGPVVSNGSGYVPLHLYKWSTDNQVEIGKGWIIKADTIKDLATKVGMDPAALEAQVAKYNQYCTDQKDPDFARDPKTLLKIAAGPFYAMKVWPGFLCTEGGPKRNPKGQIVDPWDAPIPRLYSAGELGSIAGFLYQGANDIGGECMAMGRIAARNAVAEKPWA